MEARGPDTLGGNGPPEKESQGSKCTVCCARLTSLLCSNAGVCLLVLLYTVAGAFLFTSIEGSRKDMDMHVIEPSIQHVTEEKGTATIGPGKTEPLIDSSKNSVKMRQETVEKLWTITESLNILYRDNWTRVAERELEKFSDRLLAQIRVQDQTAASRDAKVVQPYQWSFAGSFLYSLTVITTIGYGSIAPSTGLGKIVTILYALLGIPLMLLYLSSVGDLLSRFLKWVWVKLCRCGRKRKSKTATDNLLRENHLPVPGSYTNLDPKKFGKWKDSLEDPMELEGGAIPVTLCLLLMIAYISGGAAVFAYTHDWPFLNAVFFCFTALTTIGFGELSPGIGTRSETGLEISLMGASLYLLIGMALIATCFNLMQEQVTSRSTTLSRKFGNHRFHLDDT